MSVRSLFALSLVVGAATMSCSSLSTDGSTTNTNNPACLPDLPCPPPADPNGNVDPYNIPTRTGTTSAGGTSATPLDPKSSGSTGVTTGPGGAIALDLNGFKNAGAPYIWIANSSEGTESKVDVNTNLEVGRYCTYRGCNGDPSRSTVSLQGDVVVANRASYYGINTPARASAVKIAGDKSRCVDRNGNGKIDTFEGAGKIPAAFIWQASQVDSPDECVLWLTDLSKDKNGNAANTLPRAATFDATIGADGTLSKYVYIGLFNTGEILRMDSETGAVIKRIQLTGINPYGMVTDKDGNLWVRGGSLVKIDVKNNDATTNYSESPGGCGYGITADARGYIYTASSACVARFDPAQSAKGWEQAAVSGACFLRGLALDSKFNLWVADTCNGIYHMDASPAYGGGMTVKKLISPRGVGSNFYYLGIGLDKNEQPWVVSEGTGNLGTPATGGSDPSGRIYHINPTDYTFATTVVGNNPYTYSDMTGAQLRIAGSPFGIYRHTFKSDCAPLKTTWTSVTYDLQTPPGTSVDISARGAGDLTSLNTALFGPATSIPPAQAGPFTPSINEGVDNSYLQLQFKLNANSPSITPTVNNLNATFICG